MPMEKVVRLAVCSDKIANIRVELQKHFFGYYIIPAILEVLFLIYYFPIYGVVFISSEKVIFTLGDVLYQIINPFFLAPIVVGVEMLLIFVFYRSIIHRIVFTISYLISLFFSIVGVMGYVSILDYLYFIPHIIIICITVFLSIRDMKKEMDGLVENKV